MANVQDATQGISIGVIAQGYAVLTVKPVPISPNPASFNATVTVSPTIQNTGATDTLWYRLTINGSAGSYVTQSVNGGNYWYPTPTFTMPNQTTTVVVDVGYQLGSSYQLTDTNTVTVTLQQYAHAMFEGTATIVPPPPVDPGTTVVITYPVRNSGAGAGAIWGGLYYADGVTIVSGTGWVISGVQAGALVSPTPTATIIVNSAFSGLLIIGHVQ